MQSIVTLTMNPTIDKSASAQSIAAEIKIRCENPKFDPGGGGINVSRAIKKLGGASTALFTAGGFPGEMLKDLLAQENITQKAIPIAEFTRENLTIFEDSTTQQYRFGMPGPAMTTEEWVKCLDETLALKPDFLVASGSLPPAVPDHFYATISQQASEQGAKVVVDTSGKALEKAARAGVYLLKPNLRELEIFSRRTIQDNDELRDVVRELIAQGMAQVFVVSMGAQGAALITADAYVTLRPPLVPVQSKVGAGDSMVGGIVMALARGDSLVDAARWGVAAGTAAVMTPGTELCRKADTERIYEQVFVS